MKIARTAFVAGSALAATAPALAMFGRGCVDTWPFVAFGFGKFAVALGALYFGIYWASKLFWDARGAGAPSASAGSAEPQPTKPPSIGQRAFAATLALASFFAPPFILRIEMPASFGPSEICSQRPWDAPKGAKAPSGEATPSVRRGP